MCEQVRPCDRVRNSCYAEILFKASVQVKIKRDGTLAVSQNSWIISREQDEVAWAKL